MKKFLSLLVFGFSSLALAYPTVGDTVTYNMTVTTTAGVTTPITTTMTVTGYNSTSSDWQISMTAVSGDQSWSGNYSSGLLTQDQVSAILQNCTGAGGTPEQVTVPAGTFNTCRMSYSSGVTWVGDVPFGMVKLRSVNQSGSTTYAELASFAAGTK